jgi:3-oxoacyl-[acyl-carrier-protein] synthase III
MKNVYITNLSKFLPNQAIPNDKMELYLGMIGKKPSPAKRLVLNHNKIRSRYYALDTECNPTHTNAEMTSLAIQGLLTKGFTSHDIQLLSCGTTSPDQLLPSHAAMVHGLLNTGNIEIAAFAGACCTGIQALKYGYMSVASENTHNAVCTGSERLSSWLKSTKYEGEAEEIARLEGNGFVAFEKEFLRWMLSDGAAAALLQNTSGEGLSLKIDWIDMTSFANKIDTCMYAGGEKQKDGSLKSWHEFEPHHWVTNSMMSLQQDVKQLGRHIVKFGQEFLNEVVKKRGLNVKQIDYFLPHLSSDFFRDSICHALVKADMEIPEEKWFTNLSTVGNVGSASPYLMLEELFYSGRLRKGDKILMMIPESARFSYSYCHLTVC